jgi:hypothetical protein
VAAPAPATGGASAAPGNGAGGDRPRLRDMSPEERRAFMESLTPEQRAQMRERWKQRRGAREAQEAAPPDGQ